MNRKPWSRWISNNRKGSKTRMANT
jgi:hypothetical protein